MSWDTFFRIIEIAVPIIFGGTGLYSFIHFKQETKKLHLDNKKVEEDIKDTATDRLIRILDQVQEQNDILTKLVNDSNSSLNEKNAVLAEDMSKILNLSSMLSLSNNFMCLNDLCPFREPIKGLGETKFKEATESGYICGNQKNIKQIAAEHGFILKQINE